MYNVLDFSWQTFRRIFMPVAWGGHRPPIVITRAGNYMDIKSQNMDIKYGNKIAKYGYKYGNKSQIWTKFFEIWK